VCGFALSGLLPIRGSHYLRLVEKRITSLDALEFLPPALIAADHLGEVKRPNAPNSRGGFGVRSAASQRSSGDRSLSISFTAIR
jgi:hypothetical protein